MSDLMMQDGQRYPGLPGWYDLSDYCTDLVRPFAGNSIGVLVFPNAVLYSFRLRAEHDIAPNANHILMRGIPTDYCPEVSTPAPGSVNNHTSVTFVVTRGGDVTIPPQDDAQILSNQHFAFTLTTRRRSS